MRVEEQKAVIHAYKDFLNSLDFPIQIVMRTTNLNIDDYLYELRKSALEQKNPEIEKQFESFKNFVHEFIKENDVKNRLFYVIIPYSAYSNSRPVTDSINFIKSVFGGKKTKTSVEINRDNAQSQLNRNTGLQSIFVLPPARGFGLTGAHRKVSLSCGQTRNTQNRSFVFSSIITLSQPVFKLGAKGQNLSSIFREVNSHSAL